MKKLALIVTAAALAVTMTACSSGSKESSKSTESSAASTVSQTSEASKTSEESKEAGESGSVLEKEVLVKVKKQVTFPCETQDVTAKRINRSYGIEESQMDDFAGLYCVDGVNQEQFIIIKAKTEDDVADIKTKLQNSLDSLYNVIKNYTPDQVAIIEAAEVKTKDKYVYLVISSSADTINGIIEEAI